MQNKDNPNGCNVTAVNGISTHVLPVDVLPVEQHTGSVSSAMVTDRAGTAGRLLRTPGPSRHLLPSLHFGCASTLKDQKTLKCYLRQEAHAGGGTTETPPSHSGPVGDCRVCQAIALLLADGPILTCRRAVWDTISVTKRMLCKAWCTLWTRHESVKSPLACVTSAT